jgi:hypothetical protein
MTIEMTDDEKRIERTCVEYVFGLTGGELEDKPWEPWVPNTEESFPYLYDQASERWTFTYWYDGLPDWCAHDYKDRYDATYRTVVRHCLWGLPPETVLEKGVTWRRKAHFVSSGETECCLKEPWENDVLELHSKRPCEYCEAQEGEEHGYIYLGDGWCEVIYRADDEPEEEDEPDHEYPVIGTGNAT